VAYELSGIFKGRAVPPAFPCWVSSYMLPYKRGSGNVFPLATSFSQSPLSSISLNTKSICSRFRWIDLHSKNRNQNSFVKLQ